MSDHLEELHHFVSVKNLVAVRINFFYVADDVWLGMQVSLVLFHHSNQFLFADESILVLVSKLPGPSTRKKKLDEIV